MSNSRAPIIEASPNIPDEGMARSSNMSSEQVETEFFEHARPTSLIKRFATPPEVASVVACVASPLAGVIKSAF